MNSNSSVNLTGGCDCGHVRYRIMRSPIFVHCCHCSWCQRESGAAFALNAMLESSEIELLENQPKLIDTPSPSGRGQQVARCPKCQIAVWSHYAGLGELLSFIKVGTLDEVNQMPPDIHIFTSSKQDWLVLPEDGIPVYENYYDRKALWDVEQLERFDRLLEQKNVG